MKTPREIYAQFRIMPGLQLHQLRVAAVGKLICDNFSSRGGSASGGKKPINTHDVVLACLFHDMGNIIKADLTQFPQLLEPQGKEYWEGVKKERIAKYGPDTHKASVAMAKEIGLPEVVVSYVDGVRFTAIPSLAGSDSFEPKIIQYSDLRAAPFGILPLQERLEEAQKRYVGKTGGGALNEVNTYPVAIRGALEVERQIFSHATIIPEDITDASIAPIVEELWEYPAV